MARPMDDLADIYAQGLADNLSPLRYLQFRCRLTNDQAAKLCGVSVRTFRRWRTANTAPVAAVRLLAILSGYVPWSGWDGWEMHNGYLFPPGFNHHGITPGDIHAMIFLHQLVTEQRRRIEVLEREIQELGQGQRRRILRSVM